MNILENIRTALAGIWGNKMRSLLTMLGIIIGVFAVITIVTIGNSLTNSLTNSLSSMGATNINVSLSQKSTDEDSVSFESRPMAGGMTVRRGSNTFLEHQKQESDYFTTEMLEGLLSVYPDKIKNIQRTASLMTTGSIRKDGNSANSSVIGANQGYIEEMDLTILSGSNLDERVLSEQNPRKVAVVSDKLIKKLFNGDNDAALGQTIEIITPDSFYEFTIIGVYEYKDSIFSFSSGSDDDINTTVYAPINTIKQLSHISQDTEEAFIVTTVDGTDVNAFMADIKSYFEPYYRRNQYFEVTTGSMAGMLDELNSQLGIMSIGLSAIAGISLLVGGIGVMNIMLVSVSERTKEIGTRKALGANNTAIRIQFIVEAMMICLIGGAIGVGLGIATGAIVSKALGFSANTSVLSIVIALVFSMGIGMFFGFYPANRAAKMNPVDALRYE